MKSLYFQFNFAKKMEHFDKLKNLGYLNLHRNIIEKIEGLSGCVKLETLIISSNCLGVKQNNTDVEAVIGLLECPSLHTLDISDNKLDSEEILPLVLSKM